MRYLSPGENLHIKDIRPCKDGSLSLIVFPYLEYFVRRVLEHVHIGLGFPATWLPYPCYGCKQPVGT